MQAWSDQSAPLADGSRLSSSLPSQSRVNLYSASSHSHTRGLDSSIDESSLAQRTTALRQLYGIQRPFQQYQQRQQQQQPPQQHRRTTSVGSRSSLASQPVIVRTYSAEADEGSSRQPAMPRSSGSLSNRTRPNITPVRPPAVEDFGIEGILRAIEPDIQTTLDTIAEICGRSRLSLANEYGSHRPPLGEIRAPSRSVERGLLTVEEASSSTERLADETVLVVGDDISTLDGRDPYSSPYGLFENIHSHPGVIGYRGPEPQIGDERALPQQQADSRRITPLRNSVPLPSTIPSHHAPKPGHTPTTSIPSLWNLLGRETETGVGAYRQYIQTQPVLSEVHLDVEAEGTRHRQAESDGTASPDELEDGNIAVVKPLLQVAAERLSLLSDLQGWLEWCRNIGHHSDTVGGEVTPSAETTLRAVLERHSTHLSVSNPALPS